MKSLIAVVLGLTLMLVACTPLEQQARDAAAALGGAVTAAQTQHQECKTSPDAQTCVTINKAVAGQNALITSIEAYCGWTAGVLPADPNAKCKPVAGAQAALQVAIANANQFIQQLKGVIQ